MLALVLAGLPAKELCERGKRRRLQDFSLGLRQMCIISCKPCRCILLHPEGHGQVLAAGVWPRLQDSAIVC